MSQLQTRIEAARYDYATGSAATITADSKPSWGYFGIFGEAWTAQDFVTWHKALKKKYGPDKAKQVFGHEWENRPMTSAFGAAWRASEFDPDFINYFKTEGFTWGPGGKIIISATKAAESTVKVVENTVKTAENVTESASHFGKYALYVVVVLAVAAGAYILIKYPQKLKLA